MKNDFMRPYTEAELDKLGVNFKLWELCKYQQSIIDKYKDYIETYIHQKIQEEIIKHPGIDFNETYFIRHITIPETQLVVRCDRWTHHNWELLQAENPLITPEYFINIAYKEQEDNGVNRN